MNKESNSEKSQVNNFDDSQGQISIHHDTLFLFSNVAVYSCECLLQLIGLYGELRRLVRTHWLRIIARSSQEFDRSILMKTFHEMVFGYL